jgi:hypothetical protein
VNRTLRARFNLVLENRRVRKISGSGTRCGSVAPHARNNSESTPIVSHRQPSNWCVELQFSAAMWRFMHFVTTFISRTLPIVAVSDYGTRTMCRFKHYDCTQCSIPDSNKPSPPDILSTIQVRRCTVGFASGEMALRLDERHSDHAYSAPKNASG